MTTALTPKGRVVNIETKHYGTAKLEEGSLYYGNIRVSNYNQWNTANAKNLNDALIKADEFIDHYHLSI